jgi:DNA-binding transcriptional LysR family regulator
MLLVEMKQVEYFLAVSETLDFASAAERFGVERPAIEHVIRSLEAELGEELVEREQVPLRLSGLGERMLPMMRQCCEAALAAKALNEAGKTGGSVPLTLVVSRSVSVAPLLPLLHKLSRAFPHLQLHLRRALGSEVAAYVDSGEADLAIAGPLREVPPRLRAFPLFDERFDLFVSRAHELSGRIAAQFSDIASETLLINTECDMADEFAECLKTHGVAGVRSHSAASHDVLALLEADLGVAVIPVGAAQTSDVSRVPLNDLNLARTVSVYVAAGQRPRAVSATLLNMLRACDWGFERAAGQGAGVN